MKKAFINWSSGKDAAFALYLLKQKKDFIVEKLLTTINSENNRVSMHGLREELLSRQAKSIGIPLHVIPLPGNVPMEVYNKIMEEELGKLQSEGFTHSVFGDIFLEDLKQYREQQLQKVNIQPLFPLWKRNSRELMEEFLHSGFKAVIVSVNSRLLDASLCGRVIDEHFLADLPKTVDPCGENGEFHTFVYDGPIFSKPVAFKKGEIVERSFTPGKTKEDNCFKDEQEKWDNSFFYCDLL